MYEEQLIVLQETLFHFQEMLSAHQDCQVLSWQFPEIKVMQNLIKQTLIFHALSAFYSIVI